MIQKQKKVAQIAEMIHTASLVHDDVIDVADSRRSRPSVNILWGQKKVNILNLKNIIFNFSKWVGIFSRL